MPALSTSDEVPEADADGDWSVERRRGLHKCYGRHVLPPPPKARADVIANGDDEDEVRQGKVDCSTAACDSLVHSAASGCKTDGGDELSSVRLDSSSSSHLQCFGASVQGGSPIDCPDDALNDVLLSYPVPSAPAPSRVAEAPGDSRAAGGSAVEGGHPHGGDVADHTGERGKDGHAVVAAGDVGMPPSRGVIAAEVEVDALDERSRGHSVANDSLGALSYAPTSPGTVPPSSGEHREAEDDGSPSAGSLDVSSIGHVKEKAAGWRSVPDLLRDLDGGKTEFDVLIDGDDERPPIKFREPDAEPEPEFDGRLFSNIHMHSPAHLATHLPKVPGC